MAVRRRLTGYAWKRPNETVHFHGFNRREMKQIKPAIKAMDQNLHPSLKLHTSIRMAKPGQVEKLYSRHYKSRIGVKVGALTYPHRVRKHKILINPKNFHSRGYYNPGGVLTHEVGHVAHIQSGRGAKAWAEVSQGGGRTRQHHNVHEDFAESFRSVLGQKMTRRHKKYFDVGVDQSRMKVLNKHYLK